MPCTRRARPGGLDGGDDSSGVQPPATLFSLALGAEVGTGSASLIRQARKQAPRSGSHQWLCGTHH